MSFILYLVSCVWCFYNFGAIGNVTYLIIRYLRQEAVLYRYVLFCENVFIEALIKKKLSHRHRVLRRRSLMHHTLNGSCTVNTCRSPVTHNPSRPT